MSETEFVPSLTIRENLYLPLVFAAIEKDRRDKIIGDALEKHGLKAAANKFHRYLSEEEAEKATILRQDIWKHYPEYTNFLNVLKEKRGFDLSLSLIQYETFTNIARDLEVAGKKMGQRRFEEAVEALDEAIERLALRVALGPFYDIPSLRVMEVTILVIRNYRDLLKHRERIEREILETEKKRAPLYLRRLADSFIEMRSRG